MTDENLSQEQDREQTFPLSQLDVELVAALRSRFFWDNVVETAEKILKSVEADKPKQTKNLSYTYNFYKRFAAALAALEDQFKTFAKHSAPKIALKLKRRVERSLGRIVVICKSALLDIRRNCGKFSSMLKKLIPTDDGKDAPVDIKVNKFSWLFYQLGTVNYGQRKNTAVYRNPETHSWC